MLIADIQKVSLLDYPGKISAVVFVPHCNMRCWYCHNEHILGDGTALLDEASVLSYLEKRRGCLQAVVVSGGEPTLQSGLKLFLERVKEMGFLAKLDTNGLKPDRVRELLQAGLLDYVAMDIKAGPEKYSTVTQVACDMEKIRKSIFYIRNSGIAHEFRTTFAPDLTKADILSAVELICGTKAYYLQQYRKRKPTDPDPHKIAYVRETAEAVREKIGVCEIRGL